MEGWVLRDDNNLTGAIADWRGGSSASVNFASYGSTALECEILTTMGGFQCARVSPNPLNASSPGVS